MTDQASTAMTALALVVLLVGLVSLLCVAVALSRSTGPVARDGHWFSLLPFMGSVRGQAATVSVFDEHHNAVGSAVIAHAMLIESSLQRFFPAVTRVRFDLSNITEPSAIVRTTETGA